MWVEVLDADPDEGADAYDEALSVMEVMREEIAHLRRESERKDAIIMRLSESNAEQARTIREIEAPESREAGAYGPAEAGEGNLPSSSGTSWL